MPFGLSGAAYSLAAAICFVLNDCRTVAVEYYDDIIVHFKCRQDHLEHLKKIFKVLATYGILINLQKSEFIETSIEFLGYIIEEGLIKPCIQDTGEIADFPVPTDIDMLCSFIGVVGFCKKFIPDFAETVQPFFNLLKKDLILDGTSIAKKAFNTLRKNYKTRNH